MSEVATPSSSSQRMKLGELRLRIRELVDEAYDKDLVDDPALAGRSVLVPDDVKRRIRKWARAMGLSRQKKRR